MAVRKWLVVARNEYRIHTSSIRRIRPYFLYLVIGLLAVYVAFIAPAVVSPFIDDFLAFIITQAAVPMVQIILFMFFFYLILFPISDALREVQTGQLEIFLAAPIKPSDVLLGEFLGMMPFYAIAITVITGSFTALLTPLGLDMVQIPIIIIIFVVTLLSAYWIGIVIAAILRTKLGKTAHGKDIGRALAVVIILPMIAVMYAIIGGGLLEALVDPGTSGMVRTIFGVLPSSWGAEVFVSFASNPGDIGAVGFETLIRFGSLVVFFVAVLWLGAKAANRAYSLEPTTFIASRAKPDGFFYKTVRYLGGGGSSGTLLASIFKDYGRRLENLSWIA
ncbi:MAG: ABC transporter permease, partial [Candidatus Bathyarchaeota archaeon]|nr:ABC transporter permease [Candidatus Bathyarchaeota archaeon]